MNESAWLLIALALPPLGAAVMWVLAPLGRDAVRVGALVVSLATLAACTPLVLNFPSHAAEGFAITNVPWMDDALFDVRFNVGLDGLGIWMFGLSALLFVTAILVSWEAITDRAPLFYAMLLLLEFGCLGVFTARDLMLFYVFFEFTLIPLFFLIGIWGSEDRRYAAIKFFLFTFAGSVLTFLGLLAVVWWDYQSTGSGVLRFSIPDLQASMLAKPMPHSMQIAVFLAMFAGFAVKVPLFPVHTWLPLAHVQAPTAGSVILAGVLLKIGVYGFARFCMMFTPEAAVQFMPCILWLATAGIIYGALVALAQGDIKRLIAYSSVSHLGYCMLGLFAFNPLGLHGGLLQMVNHGLSTGGLFAVIGMVYERYHTREIKRLSGLAKRLPKLAVFMLIFTFSSIGLPGLNGFPGEIMVLQGMFQRAWTGASGVDSFQLMLIAVLSVSGVVLGAWYMLQLVQKVFFGPLQEPESHDAHGHHDSHGHHVADLSPREFFALAPLVIFIVWIGLRPNDFIQPVDPQVRSVLAAVKPALDRRASIADSTVRSSEAPDQETIARVR